MRVPCILNHGLALLIGGLACTDSAGPSLHGTPFLSATVAGARFTSDTTVALLFGVTPDTGVLTATGVSRDSEHSTREITISLREFPRIGSFPIGDQTAPSSAVFSISYHTAGVVDSFVVFGPKPSQPGTLRITALDRADSLVTGQFSFVAYGDVAHPGPRPVSGTFRFRYSYQQIFLPTRQ